MSGLKPHIAKVASGASLSFEEAKEAFGIIMSGDATPGQVGGFLMALRVRGETVDEISGAVATMREKMVRVAGAGRCDRHRRHRRRQFAQRQHLHGIGLCHRRCRRARRQAWQSRGLVANRRG